MKVKVLAVLVSGLLVSSLAMADALIQSVSLGATTQLGVVSLTPTSVVSASAPLTAQTASVNAVSGNPSVSVLTDTAPTVAVSGMGSASVTVIQSATGYSSIPVLAPGSVLAAIPAVAVVVPSDPSDPHN